MFLTSEELRDLTHKKIPAAQIRALRTMGIDHKRRPDGTVLVLKAVIEKSFGLDEKQPKKRPEPNWDMVK